MRPTASRIEIADSVKHPRAALLTAAQLYKGCPSCCLVRPMRIDVSKGPTKRSKQRICPGRIGIRLKESQNIKSGFGDHFISRIWTRNSCLLLLSTMATTFESLPVELIADILSELDLESLVKLSYLSRRLHHITSDSSLNPWRRPILVNLRSQVYENTLKHLSVRLTVPRQNWVEILSIARPSFLLFEATLPNLKAVEWEECFNRRFLPGWRKWKKEGSWKEVFLKFASIRNLHDGSTDSALECCNESGIDRLPLALQTKLGQSQFQEISFYCSSLLARIPGTSF